MGRKIFKVMQAVVLILVCVVLLLTGALMIGLDMRPCIVVSGSMEPAIPTGSLCLIDGRQTKPEEGQIAAYKAGEMTVTHRVVEVTPDGYRTKGDHNDTADPGIVSPSQVIGTCVWSLPHAGYLVMWLRSPSGMLAAMALVLGLGLGGILLDQAKL